MEWPRTMEELCGTEFTNRNEKRTMIVINGQYIPGLYLLILYCKFAFTFYYIIHVYIAHYCLYSFFIIYITFKLYFSYIVNITKLWVDYRYYGIIRFSLIKYFLFFPSILFYVRVIQLCIATHHVLLYNQYYFILLSILAILYCFFIVYLFQLCFVCREHRSLYIALFNKSVLILRFSYIIKLVQLTPCLLSARTCCTYCVNMHKNDSLILFFWIYHA